MDRMDRMVVVVYSTSRHMNSEPSACYRNRQACASAGPTAVWVYCIDRPDATPVEA